MNYFSRLPQDIILSYILPRLDGETLIALSSLPSLLSCRPIVLSTMISMFSGGYRSFFSAAFPSIHHGNTAPPPPPPLPPCVYFTYAIDIFLQGEQEQEPLYAEIQEQQINIKTYPSSCLRKISSTVGSDAYFASIKTSNRTRWVVAVYETVMPGLCKDYTEMVKFKVKVECGWVGGKEDRLYVKYINFRMEDMNGKHLKEVDAAKALLNAIINGERKKK
ncbi:hypothetical protein P8452_68915 [Trifolium repens]|nr:hypothetical protein P8452_68915 [Trifolium repens]